ncbi:DUF2332 family protein [Hoeflea sp. WL0058]|uniref:DUF2332 family protein n=1 Tax=Flavimaribacter sediminis TaxID=2865987 RepID=A0AAE2ZLB5_9HYPH|nr:DUF2332 family protein [Flavimaribacter sediminis]MBW8636418.1 DUF2332 family protein [Flavimaribacter sediminis]
MTPGRLPERVNAVFLSQAESCEKLGSPFTALLLRSIAQYGLPETPVRQRLATWKGDISGSGDSIPLRLAGTLHQMVIRNLDADLAAIYPPHGPMPDPAIVADTVAQAILRHQAFVDHCLDSPPQTNEIRRSSAIYPALLRIAAQTGLPIRLSEVGASAGLNLLMDRFHYRFGDVEYGEKASPVHLEPDWKGCLPPAVDLDIVARRGCDLRPFDLRSEDDRIRLRSYTWPDQQDRLDRLDAAIELARKNRFVVDRADAVEWLEQRLRTRPAGRADVVFNTIAWQYLPDEARMKGNAIIEKAGQQAGRDSPLFWVSMEADDQRPGALLQMIEWPGARTTRLGRADFHGRWVDWQA